MLEIVFCYWKYYIQLLVLYSLLNFEKIIIVKSGWLYTWRFEASRCLLFAGFVLNDTYLCISNGRIYVNKRSC